MAVFNKRIIEMCNPVFLKGKYLYTDTSLNEKSPEYVKEKVRTLTNSELSLKVVDIPFEPSVRERIIEMEDDKYFQIDQSIGKNHIKIKPKYSVLIRSMKLEIHCHIEKGEHPRISSWPCDHKSKFTQYYCLDFLETDGFFESVLCKSMRIDENIITNRLCHNLPQLNITVCSEENSKTDFCLHAPMRGIGLSVFSENQPKIKYLATAGLYDCYAVIFWNSVNQETSMAHFLLDDLCPTAFDLMIESMSKCDIANIKMFVVGGYTHKLAMFPGFFSCIEKYAISKNIYIHQTFLGNQGQRPKNIIFDVESGILFKLSVKENLTKHKLTLVNAANFDHGEKVHFIKNLDAGTECSFATEYEREYRLFDGKNKDLLIPVLAEISVETPNPE